MERLNSSQQSQSVSGLEEQKTPVLEQEVIPLTSTDSKSDIIKSVSLSKRHLQAKVVLGVLLGAGATFHVFMHTTRGSITTSMRSSLRKLITPMSAQIFSL